MGAQSLISVNMHQGWVAADNSYAAGSDAWPAQHASQWLGVLNANAQAPSTLPPYPPLGKVAFWELGNEPYLVHDPDPAHGWPHFRSISPERFASRAGQTAQALLATDPGVKTILPMSLGVVNNRVANAYWQGTNGQPAPYHFMDRVMPLIPDATIDAVGLHVAYMPAAGAGPVPGETADDNLRCPQDYYWAAMAAPATVVKSINSVLGRAGRLYGSKFRAGPKAAITEYSPVFAFNLNTIQSLPAGSCPGGTLLGTPETDVSKWGATPAGGLYVAELVRQLADQDKVMLAAHWSVHGNDSPEGNNRFGGLTSGPPNWQDVHVRPIHQVLTLWNAMLPVDARRLAVTHTLRETRATPSIGYAEAQAALPVLEAAATRFLADGVTRLAILVINKDPARTGSGVITIKNGKPAAVSTQALFSTELLRDDGVANFSEAQDGVSLSGSKLTVTMPPGSVRLIRLSLL